MEALDALAYAHSRGETVLVADPIASREGLRASAEGHGAMASWPSLNPHGLLTISASAGLVPLQQG